METMRPRVLLADDEFHIRSMMKAVIKMMGYDLAAEAINGQEAIDRFKELKPDITLLDINMPIKTGMEVLKEIINAQPDACVIMLTSVSDLSSVQECVDLGAANYIRKDTHITEMKTCIADTWQAHKSK